MPNPQLRVVPEVLAPCRAAKGVVGALIVIALVGGLIAATARTHQDALPVTASMREATSASIAASATTRPAGAEDFPAGDTLNANETTPHIEAF